MYFFFSLISTMHAETLPGLPTSFVPMNGGETPFKNKFSKKCLTGDDCSKEKEKITVSTLQEGVATDKRPIIGDLYDCDKQTMQGVIQSQNHKFCSTREAKVESFTAHIFEFFRVRKLLKAQLLERSGGNQFSQGFTQAFGI